MTKLIAVSLFLFLSAGVVGVGSAQQPKKDPCHDEEAFTRMSQQEMNDCARKGFEQADAELNKVYKELMKQLPPEHQAKLKTAQLAWLKYRDATCECVAFPNEGGSIYPLIYNGCRGSVTQNRTKELKEMLEEINGNRTEWKGRKEEGEKQGAE